MNNTGADCELNYLSIWMRGVARAEGHEELVRDLIRKALNDAIDCYGLPGEGPTDPFLEHDVVDTLTKFAMFWDENARMSGDTDLENINLEDGSLQVLVPTEQVKQMIGEVSNFEKIVNSPYTLRLTKEDRKAIDFVGGRYSHGYDLYKLLWSSEVTKLPDCDWDAETEIVFGIPEHIAFQIQEAADENEHRWELFGSELVMKLETLLGKIV